MEVMHAYEKVILEDEFQEGFFTLSMRVVIIMRCQFTMFGFKAHLESFWS